MQTSNAPPPPTIERYHVRRAFGGGGKKVVSFKCPSCRQPLNADLDDAGSADACPICIAAFIVPGTSELTTERQQAEAKRKAADEIDRTANPVAAPPKPAHVIPRSELAIPDYPMTHAISELLLVVATMEILAAIVMFTTVVMLTTVELIPFAIGLGAHALICFFSSEALRIMRDIGRNSWHMRRSLERLHIHKQ